MNSSLSAAPFDGARRAKILVVDDEVTNIRLMHGLLKSRYDVFMATDGEQALKQVTSIVPDLILLDVVMPGISGHEICQRLKDNPDTADIPIIFITAQNEEAEEIRGLELGAVDFIHKPVNAVILQARVNTHVTLQQQRKLLQNLASVDGLTGIANRRRFDEFLEMHWMQSARSKLPISIILFDVDHFKKFNDHYGHRAGDECLMRIAGAAARATRRPLDLAARYGGEEFACILPDTDSAGAIQIAESIIRNVQECAIPHEAVGPNYKVGISAGISTHIATLDKSSTWLVECADKQLYRAKMNGRGRWESEQAGID
jgi:diguanylate cyclase (GGDEF)-like protein